MGTKKTIFGSIGAILILVASQIVAQLIGSGLVVLHFPVWIGNVVAGVLYVCCAYYALKIFADRYLKLSLQELGIPKFKIAWKWIVIAFALPITVTIFYLLLPGKMYQNDLSVMAVASAGIFFTGIGAGVVEEMVFRGFILNLLKKRWNRIVAVVVPSVLFGALHLMGMEFSVVSVWLVLAAGTAVGVMFSLIEIEHDSVWNSGIVHVMWNIVIIGGILQISSVADEYAVYNYVLNVKSVILTGGEFGIEASLIALIGYIVVSLVAMLGIRKSKRNDDSYAV